MFYKLANNYKISNTVILNFKFHQYVYFTDKSLDEMLYFVLYFTPYYRVYDGRGNAYSSIAKQ
jgi:hypothetical protein